MLKTFLPALDGDAELAALGAEVQDYARAFPMPGMDVATMKYGVAFVAAAEGEKAAAAAAAGDAE